MQNQRSACEPCRRKKEKCSGQKPCVSCARFNEPCFFETKAKSGPKPGYWKKMKEENSSLKKALESNISKGSQLFSLSSERTYVETYFTYMNAVIPFVVEEKYKVAHFGKNPSMEHQFLHFAIMALGARYLNHFEASLEFLELARTFASSLMDNPSEEAASAFGLLSYYALGMGNFVKGTLYLTLAINMGRLVPVHENHWACMCILTFIGFFNPASGMNGPPTVSMNPPDPENTAAFILYKIFVLFILTAKTSLPPLYKMEPEDIDIAQKHLDEARQALKMNPKAGGVMNFAFALILQGKQAMIHKNTMNRQKEAEEWAMLVSSATQKTIKCHILVNIFYIMAKIHQEGHQMDYLEKSCKHIEIVAETWPVVDSTYKKILIDLAVGRAAFVTNACKWPIIFREEPRVEEVAIFEVKDFNSDQDTPSSSNQTTPDDIRRFTEDGLLDEKWKEEERKRLDPKLTDDILVFEPIDGSSEHLVEVFSQLA